MRLLKAGIALTFVLMIAVSAKASVWQTTRHWDLGAEQEFGEWIRLLPLDVFSNPQSRYHGISTDCGDAAYVLRIIFAYEHGLPVRFQNSPDLSNSTTRFDSLAAGSPLRGKLSARIRSFIDLVRNRTSTEALANDTYPIEISRQSLRSGAMLLHAASNHDASVPATYRSGHVYYIQSVNYQNGMIRYMGSTVPEAVRSLSVRYGTWYVPQETDSGYRAWKWPDSYDQPFASNEQFRIGDWRPRSFGEGHLEESWQEAVQARIRSRKITPSENYAAVESNLRSALQERSTAVLEGWDYYAKNYSAGQCMEEPDYEDYSTPSRDTKLQKELNYYRTASIGYLELMRKNGQVRSDVSFKDQVRGMFERFVFEPIPGTKMNYLQLWKAFMTDTVYDISEPEHSPKVRWGLTPQGRWPCPERRAQYR